MSLRLPVAITHGKPCFGVDPTRRLNALNPAWIGDFGQRKGPETFRACVGYGGWGLLNDSLKPA